MFGPCRVGRDVGQVDGGLHAAGELFLGSFRCFLEPLHGTGISRQVDACVLAEFFGQPVDDPLIKVIAAEPRVAV